MRKNVYFHIRESARERMWATINAAKEVCNVLTPPDVKPKHSLILFLQHQNLINRIKPYLTRYIFKINFKHIPKNFTKIADYIYLWGAIPKNLEKSFIVELDNPYCITFYHKDVFINKKEELVRYLMNSHKIVCMSDACMQHFNALTEGKLQDKTVVLYPYVDRGYIRNQRSKDLVNFLFIGLSYRIKGLLELLEAFRKINNSDIRLTIVSYVPEEIQKEYSSDTRITFFPPRPREELLRDVYPKMDVLILPTLYESFGVVVLEALSFGMGVIATNVYAMPEMVIDGFNGRLLHHPFIKPKPYGSKEIANCVDLPLHIFYKLYLSRGEFYYSLYHELRDAIKDAIKYYKNWQENSVKLFNEKFAPEVWYRNFKVLIE